MNFDKKFKILAVLGMVIISSILVGSITGDENDAVNPIEDNLETKTLKKSDYWTNFTYIHVKNNWSDFGSWLKGDGSWSNPYRIENMTIDATGTPTGSGILIEDSQNQYFEIRNCTITNWGGGAYDGAIHILNSSDGLLEQNDCSGGGNGIVLNGDLTGTCENITIFNNTIDGNTIRGIRITDYASGNRVFSNRIRDNDHGVVCFDHALNNTIKDNNITGNTRGIYFQSYSDNNVIKYNNISDNGYGIYFMDHCDDNKIHHNLISENTNDGIYLWNYNDLNYIAYNNLSNNYNGIYFYEWNDYNTIINNNASNNGWCGIQIDSNCFYNNIENNTANYNGGAVTNECGIFLYRYCDFNNVTHNTVIGNTYWGIWMLAGSDNNLINNNTVSTHITGINIQSSDSNTIINNTITQSTTEGVYVHVNTLSNIITKNTIDNNQWGVHLKSNADTTDITDNLIINNGNLGVYIEDIDSENNEVWLNYFTNNGINAQDSSDPSDNSWDKGGTGNYWDDYSGYDCNSDNIGETPYTNIAGTANSQDNFPIWSIPDPTPPVITENNINSMDLFGTTPPVFNLVITEYELNDTWYRLWNGTVLTANETFVYNQGVDMSMNQTVWDQVGNGTVTISFYANDTCGNWNFYNVTVRKDIFTPIIDINVPAEGQIYNAITPFFDVIITGNIDETWYSFYNGLVWTANQTWTGSLPQAVWNLAGNGTVIVKIWANSTTGIVGFSQRTFRKDILAPILTIVNPLNNDIRAKTNRTFNFIIVEGNLDTMWYSIAEGQNHTFTVSGSLDQADWDAAWDATPWDDAFLVRFYANDTAGNIISIDVWIKTNKQAPAKPAKIPFGHIYFIIIGISTIALIVINKRKLNQK